MRNSRIETLTLSIALGVLVGVSRPLSGQVPTKTSAPRLAVPQAGPTTVPAQPTAVAAPGASAPTAPASPDTTPPGGAGAPVTQVTGASSGVTKLGTGAQPADTGSQPTSSSAQAATIAPDKRSYTAGKFALTVDGASVGYLKSLAGGTPVGEVVQEVGGPAFAPKKHLGNLKYEEITAVVGIGGKPLLDWIAQSWKGNFQRKSGSIVDLDFNYKPVSERQFQNALITETTIPTLDGSSKDAAYFTVKIAPETIRQSAGSAVKADVGLKQKAWLASNFRFEMTGLDGSRVARIESFTVGQSVATGNVGEMRDYEKQPGKLVFPNLKLSLSQSSVASWAQWFDDFVVRGNNGDDQERNGAILFLGPDMKSELGRVNLFNCGIFRLAPETAEANSEKIKRVTAELYCERMELGVQGGGS